jgi:hypothetical protein
MDKYYVNKNAQTTGEHEVHKEGCEWMPLAENRIYLGEFYSCSSALRKAREYYDNVDGCYYCCKECHTR